MTTGLTQWREIMPPEVNKIAGRIHKLRQRTCEDVIAIGRLLIEAKAHLEHGEWCEWLRREFAWSRDTAENFIHVADTFGDGNTETFRRLDVSSLYLLARPSTPQEARDTVAELIADDTPPALADVKRIIREAKGTEEPEPTPQPEPPKARQAALAAQFQAAVEGLMSLSTKPTSAFAGIMPADDLDMLGNFLKQIAAASRKAA